MNSLSEWVKQRDTQLYKTSGISQAYHIFTVGFLKMENRYRMKLLTVTMLIFSANNALERNQNEANLEPDKTLASRFLPTVVEHNSEFYESEYANDTMFSSASYTFSKSLTTIFAVIWTTKITFYSE